MQLTRKENTKVFNEEEKKRGNGNGAVVQFGHARYWRYPPQIPLFLF
jgi:hypothetical protein